MISGILKSIKNTFKAKQQPQKDVIVEIVKTVTGKAIQKKYIKHRKLGSGAFAQCYLTENVQTKKVYATKIISKNNQNRTKLLNQLVIHQQLHHENIVDFSHAFQDQNEIYVFMELCTNDSLEHLLQKKYTLTTPQIQKFIFQIIQGVKYIHSKNLIHRDLKPKNIFLGEDNVIKIGDFGLACKLEFEDDRKTVSCGTPQYMAPQQIDGRSYGKQVDVWAIGILLYEMYVGRTPFLDSSNELIKDNIRNLQYVYSEKGIPKDALTLIKRILIRNPQLRPTLDQILQSSFFKGQQAEISSMLSPRKINSFNINFEQSSVFKSANSSKLQYTVLPQQNNLKRKCPYISQIEQVGTQIILYTMSNGSIGLFAKNKQILHEGNKQINIVLNKTNENNDNKNNTNYKMILKNYKMKKQSKSVDDLTSPRKLEKYKEEVYLTKFSKHRNIYICRLSNNHIQLRFEDKTSLLTSLSNLEENTIYINEHNIITQITQQELFLNDNSEYKGIDEDKIKYAKRIYKSIGITDAIRQRKQIVQCSNPIDNLT